jgi:hypothetical protein
MMLHVPWKCDSCRLFLASDEMISIVVYTSALRALIPSTERSTVKISRSFTVISVSYMVGLGGGKSLLTQKLLGIQWIVFKDFS